MEPRSVMWATSTRRWSGCSGAILLAAVLAVVGCSRDSTTGPSTTTAAPAAASSGDSSAALRSIVLATTTSTQDSGLLDVLIPAFSRRESIAVKVVAVGTGEALAMGSRGDADVLLVHAPAKEREFVAQGNGSLRLAVMHNDFVLLGPAADPAAIKGLDVLEALRRIADGAKPFASRGDRSGTHTKELALWSEAERTVDKAPWRFETGQGMGETLRIATEKQAYVLADRGTFLAQRKSLELVVLSEGSTRLVNPYAVIVVSPTKFPKVHAKEAEIFARWLVGAEAQSLIATFGADTLGQPLFVPDAAAAGPDAGVATDAGEP